jgi:Tfp pilus assembly protein PilV
VKEDGMRIVRSNESGFTLIEIMISAGITFVLAYAVATVITSTNKQESSIRLKQEMFNYQQTMRYERKIIPPPTPDP